MIVSNSPLLAASKPGPATDLQAFFSPEEDALKFFHGTKLEKAELISQVTTLLLESCENRELFARLIPSLDPDFVTDVLRELDRTSPQYSYDIRHFLSITFKWFIDSDSGNYTDSRDEEPFHSPTGGIKEFIAALDSNTIQQWKKYVFDSIGASKNLKDWRRHSISNERYLNVLSKKDQEEIGRRTAAYLSQDPAELKAFAKLLPKLSTIFLKNALKALLDTHPVAMQDLWNYISEEYHLCRNSEDVDVRLQTLNALRGDFFKIQYLAELQARLLPCARGELSRCEHTHSGPDFSRFVPGPGMSKAEVETARFGSPKAIQNVIHGSYSPYTGVYGRVVLDLKPHEKIGTLEALNSATQAAAREDDPAKAVTDMLKKLPTGERLVRLIHEILQDKDAMQRIAAKSFYHPLGKYKIAIDTAGDVSVNLHLWNEVPTDAHDNYTHTHHAHFGSLLLSRDKGAHHFIFDARQATDVEKKLYRTFLQRIEDVRNPGKLKQILHSLTNLQTKEFGPTFYDQTVSTALEQLNKKYHMDIKDTSDTQEALLNETQLKDALKMTIAEVKTVATMASVMWSPTREDPAYYDTEVVVLRANLDRLTAGSAYYLGNNIFHRYVPEKNLFTMVIRKGHVGSSSNLEVVPAPIFDRLAQENGKIMRRRERDYAPNNMQMENKYLTVSQLDTLLRNFISDLNGHISSGE